MTAPDGSDGFSAFIDQIPKPTDPKEITLVANNLRGYLGYLYGQMTDKWPDYAGKVLGDIEQLEAQGRKLG